MESIPSTSSKETNDTFLLSSSEDIESVDPCKYSPPPYLIERFWLVSVFGTSVALISIIENMFLLFMLCRSRQHRNSHSFYLLLLAFCDVFIALAYIPLMSFSLLLDYFESLLLLRAWFNYMIPMITISHIAITSSSFLIVAASFERFAITINSTKVRFLHKYRKQIGFGAILIGIFAKITLALEFEITVIKQCLGTMMEYSLNLSSFATNRLYNLIWRLWIRSIVTVLLPFCLLAFINAKIVLVLQRSEFVQLLHLEKISEVQRKSRVRAATRTLLLLVFTYLISNILNVCLTIWEYIDMNSLTVNFYAFYTFGVDCVSILTVVAGALRLPIYVTCQPQIRNECQNFFKHFIKKIEQQQKPKEELSTSSNTLHPPMLVRITELLLKYPHINGKNKSFSSPLESDLSSSDGDDDEKHYGQQKNDRYLMAYSNQMTVTCNNSENNDSFHENNTIPRIIVAQNSGEIFL
uniref:G-protein coupled receptors family 1 profile domain-containing protein n=1 Tax=Panagrolaimus sp. PS1159 TaxID=55785 RepID=A0AC35GKC8_9BILA